MEKEVDDKEVNTEAEREPLSATKLTAYELTEQNLGRIQRDAGPTQTRMDLRIHNHRGVVLKSVSILEL